MADDIREDLRDIIRGRKIGPFGPNSLAILVNGGVSHLTPREAEDIADAILASPVVARIRAEAYAEGVAAPKVNGQLYHGRASIHSRPEGAEK